jgi:hypothetical protein
LRIRDPVTGSHFTSFTLGTCLMQTMVFIVISMVNPPNFEFSAIEENRQL